MAESIVDQMVSELRKAGPNCCYILRQGRVISVTLMPVYSETPTPYWQADLEEALKRNLLMLTRRDIASSGVGASIECYTATTEA